MDYLHHICVLFLNNILFQGTGMVPLQHSLGSTNDIRHFLCFHVWEEVYYQHDDSDLPSGTCEGHGNFVDMAENLGHAVTYKILTSNTNKKCLLLHCTSNGTIVLYAV